MTPRHFCAEPERFDRQGFPEAVYRPGKTLKQIIDITRDLLKGNGPVIITRAEKEIFSKVHRVFKTARYYDPARVIVVRAAKPGMSRSYIAVVTAGTTDVPAAEEAAVIAEAMGRRVERLYDVGVAGVHRLLKEQDLLLKASCVVVCAGMEGALASVVGGIVACPVIGVPTSVGYGASFNGVAALLSMLNSCAANVSVVNIDDGFGAGVIASLIDTQKGTAGERS